MEYVIALALFIALILVGGSKHLLIKSDDPIYIIPRHETHVDVMGGDFYLACRRFKIGTAAPRRISRRASKAKVSTT